MSRTAVPNERRRQALTIAAVLLGVLGYEGLMHWAMVSGAGHGAGPLCALAPLVVLLCWVAWRQSRALGLAVLLLVGVVVLAVVRTNPDLKLLYPAPNITVYLLLLWFFARTLTPGREPLVTCIARHVHGVLPPEIAIYTRQVTWAWCIYFGTMTAASILLFAFAPLRVWSWFANMLNVPFILLMFVAEYAFRLWRFPNFTHASFFTAIRAFRDLKRASVIQGR